MCVPRIFFADVMKENCQQAFSHGSPPRLFTQRIKALYLQQHHLRKNT